MRRCRDVWVAKEDSGESAGTAKVPGGFSRPFWAPTRSKLFFVMMLRHDMLLSLSALVLSLQWNIPEAAQGSRSRFEHPAIYCEVEVEHKRDLQNLKLSLSK